MPLRPSPDEQQRLYTSSNANSSITLSATTATTTTTTASRVKRLELRNAGFRGTTLPTRNVTPSSMSISTWSSRVSSPNCAVDLENMPPGGGKISEGPFGGSRRTSSGVLQEISNRNFHMSKQTLFAPNSNAPVNEYDASFPKYLSSPPLASAPTLRIRPGKNRRKVVTRCSASGETTKYIEHLEAELAAAQAELAKANSPTTVKMQQSHARSLSAETRKLQAEVDSWGERCDQLVADEVERYSVVESDLRARVRTLEEFNEEANIRTQEMRHALEAAQHNFAAVEAANVQLEKRLEIMSELLASAPSIDLHVQTPGRRKLPRPHSIVPRMPIVGPVLISPDRTSGPSSPTLSSGAMPGPPPLTFIEAVMAAGAGAHQTESSSENASVTSGAAHTSDRDFFPEGPQSTDDIPDASSAQTATSIRSGRPKPTRRMRRFGAGSIGPKLLILPSTKNCDYYPTSASAHDDAETPTPYPFASGPPIWESPIVTRRKSSAPLTAHASTPMPTSPRTTAPQVIEADKDSLLLWPSEVTSDQTRDEFSSFGSLSGQNLMDELRRARLMADDSSVDKTTQDQQRALEEGASSFMGTEVERPTVGLGIFEEVGPIGAGNIDPSAQNGGQNMDEDSLVSYDDSTSLMLARKSPQAILRSAVARNTLSTLDRTRLMVKTTWHSRLDLVRHLIDAAEKRIWIPQPLRIIQWWLVRLLWKPIVRRMRVSDINSPNNTATASRPPSDREQSGYGTIYCTPPAKSKFMAGQGRKRSPGGKQNCEHRLKRHSPWLWMRFSITLAVAIGTAFTSGPGSLLKTVDCTCGRRSCQRDGSCSRSLTPSS